MSSVTSVNPGVSNLMQLLSSAGSGAVSSALSTPAVQSALRSAPPVDIVQLSQQAVELEVAGGLFGNSDLSQTSASSDNLLLQALDSSLTGSNAAGTASGPTASALEQAYALFGANANSGAGNGLLSFFG